MAKPNGFKLGVAPKLVSTTVLITAAVAIALSVQASARLAENITAEFASKGEAIALSLAAAVEQTTDANISMVQGLIDSSKVIAGVKYIYIQDQDGKTLVHTFSPSFPSGFEKTNPLQLGELSQGQRVKRGDVDVVTPSGDIRTIDIAAPVSGGALGAVHVGMDRMEIAREVSKLRRSMVVWALSVSLVGIALGLFMILSTVVRPIRALTRVTSEIVRTGNLSQPIPRFANDEVGQLAESFSEMVQQLKQIHSNLQSSVAQLSTSVTNLRSSSDQQNEMVSRQAAALQETQATAQEIKQTSFLANKKAEEVLKVAERADEIGRSGEATIERTLAGLTDMRAQVEQIARKIGELGDRTRQIGGITQTVKDLADQSNMLALNAAIEAVRSGEHGKGFAVVAREIRSLADQSISATNRVREILEDIGEAVRAAVAITEKGSQKMETELAQVKSSGENLRELSTIVRDNSAAVRQIAAAVSQQSAGISQIFGAVTDLSRMMNETVDRLHSTTEATGVVRNVTEQVSTVLTSYRV
jgi:methyl-accepting chemotaxis protein